MDANKLDELERWPDVMQAQREQVDRLVMPTPAMERRKAALVSRAYGDTGADVGEPSSGAGLPFAFLRSGATETDAIAALGMAVSALLTEQEINRGIQASVEAMASSAASAETWDQHCAMIERKRSNDARLAQLVGGADF